MKIYVAGASKEIEKIEGFIERLRMAGHTITFDWTVAVRQVGDASPDDGDIRKASARADLDGVENCHIFWLVKPSVESTSTGAWVELGFALSFPGKTTIASGDNRKCIFADLVDREFDEHEEALRFLLEECR